MKTFTSTTLLAAITALGLGIAPAFANAQSPTGGYVFPRYGEGVPAQQAPGVTAQAGTVTDTYVTHSNQGIWLFPPDQNGGANG